MQLNQAYVPNAAVVQANKFVPMEKIYFNQALLQNCPVFSFPWDTLMLRGDEGAERLQQEEEQTVPSPRSRAYPFSPLTTRKEKNLERERKRQTRLKGAFNVLRSVIPDHFSEREPGDRLSRIQTLRLAKKYIAALHEMLEAS